MDCAVAVQRPAPDQEVLGLDVLQTWIGHSIRLRRTNQHPINLGAKQSVLQYTLLAGGGVEALRNPGEVLTKSCVVTVTVL